MSNSHDSTYKECGDRLCLTYPTWSLDLTDNPSSPGVIKITASDMFHVFVLIFIKSPTLAHVTSQFSLPKTVVDMAQMVVLVDILFCTNAEVDWTTSFGMVKLAMTS
jgi:hypothetical protein